MRFQTNFAVSALATALLLGGCANGSLAQPPAPTDAEFAALRLQRGLKICVAADAPEPVRRAAQQLLAAVGTHPLLEVMAAGRAPLVLTDSRTLVSAKPQERAYNHLILVGLPDDPMIQAAWQREARVEAGGFSVFGWGHLRGDIGYLESDRNPFLHGAAIARAPFETEVVTLCGSTPQGVALAVRAFLEQKLVNGVVAAPKWTRPQTTLLDREPLAPDFALPDVPQNAGQSRLIGLTAGGEDEYRGVLEDVGTQPLQIWRAKYFRDGAWDGAGGAKAFDNYSAGLHRRAYGSTLWMARFASTAAASQAAPKIAAAAKLTLKNAVWTGAQPPYMTGDSSGPLRLWTRGEWVWMSTLASDDTAALGAK